MRTDTKCLVCGEKSTYKVVGGVREYKGLCQLHLVAPDAVRSQAKKSVKSMMAANQAARDQFSF